ncbi:MAG: DUF1707 domain-containing protein [Herbiconiux sp.]|nr:DUF1707 domain-containing protein [Herbiconiux sp.]
MAAYDDPRTAAHRLSDSEREDAVAALARSLADGRITTEEFTERSASAKKAVTQGDLAPLFADLPDPRSASVPASATAPAPDPDFSRGSDAPGRLQPLGGRAGIVVVSIMPFVALALFFLCAYAFDGWAWAWIFFLLIPLAGSIVYGFGRRRRDDGY